MKINLYKIISTVATTTILLSSFVANAQSLKRKVLFIGNSYTATNMLPLLTKDCALSAGDTLETDWNAPGGYTFELHSSDLTTNSKIAIGNWNYVVLQEQSQRPAFSDMEVATDVFPYAKKLDSLVHDKNKCGRSVFFQTWGYRDGDASNCPVFPPICTYTGMDSMLELRYRQMATDNKALLSPVGLVFREIRASFPSINLYEPDLSHPSPAGSYAAAVTFYTILFGKNPNLITFNYTIPPPEANQIRQIVFLNVYSSLVKFGVGAYDPDANFTYATSGVNKMDFNSSTSKNAINYNWNFGDGGTSTIANPTHTYATPGTYTVRLIVDDCMIKDTTTQSVIVPVTGSVQNYSALNNVKIFPNPASTFLTIESPISTQNLKYSISNMLGSIVVVPAAILNKPINIEHLSSGVYMLTLTDEQSGASVMRKFVKN